MGDYEIHLLELSFNTTNQFIALMDSQMSIKKVNRALLNLIHTDIEELYDIPYWELPLWSHSYELQNRIMFSIEQIFLGEEVHFEASYMDINGENRDIDFTIKPIFDEDGEVETLVAMGYDVTDIKLTSSQLNKVEKELKLFFDAGVDGYFIRSLDKCIYLDSMSMEESFKIAYYGEKVSKYNDSLVKILELNSQNYDGISLFSNERFDIGYDNSFVQWQEMISHGHVRFEVKFNDDNGDIKYIEMTNRPIIEDEKYYGSFGTVKDITEMKKNQQFLFKLANYDSLTGISNRSYFIYKITKYLTDKSNDSSVATVAMFDIDHFKLVNDNYGHNIGDIVLKQVASTIASVVTAGNFFARMGGEEFCAFIFKPLDEAVEMVERVVVAVRNLEFPDITPKLKVSISAGVTAVRPDDDYDEFYKRSDKALYMAKSAGRDRVHVI